MQTKQIGQAGLRGWRSSLADAAAGPVAKKSPLSEDQVRALIGGVFLLLSLLYVAQALGDIVREQRS